MSERGRGAVAAEALVGVISDTHGMARPEALEALDGVDLIVHAGDIGPRAVFEQFLALAPVEAVRGNVDGGWAGALPETRLVEVAGRSLYLIHDLERLDLEPAAAGITAVIYGHSHRPSIERRSGVLYLNPGSAGPRRFTLPVSVATLHVSENGLEVELIELDV